MTSQLTETNKVSITKQEAESNVEAAIDELNFMRARYNFDNYTYRRDAVAAIINFIQVFSDQQASENHKNTAIGRLRQHAATIANGDNSRIFMAYDYAYKLLHKQIENMPSLKDLKKTVFTYPVTIYGAIENQEGFQNLPDYSTEKTYAQAKVTYKSLASAATEVQNSSAQGAFIFAWDATKVFQPAQIAKTIDHLKSQRKTHIVFVADTSNTKNANNDSLEENLTAMRNFAKSKNISFTDVQLTEKGATDKVIAKAVLPFVAASALAIIDKYIKNREEGFKFKFPFYNNNGEGFNSKSQKIAAAQEIRKFILSKHSGNEPSLEPLQKFAQSITQKYFLVGDSGLRKAYKEVSALLADLPSIDTLTKNNSNTKS